ncbi:MAG: winged helix-turn-helix transcriptional regulator [Bacteroidetes bacterium]|nr:winged helix-turn-helix transcriptional regulator [Bacteroidota bacterium]
MNKDIENTYLDSAEMFKALSHPTRLFIINTIKDKKFSVRELSTMAEIDISTMSKHLNILKKNKIIKGEKVKNFIYYKLEIPCVLDFITCATKIIKK